MLWKIVLLIGLLISHSALAEGAENVTGSDAVDAVIVAQGRQIELARQLYNEQCFSPDSIKAVKEASQNRACQFSQDAYQAEVEYLIRILHGDPAILCIGDDCPSPSE